MKRAKTNRKKVQDNSNCLVRLLYSSLLLFYIIVFAKYGICHFFLQDYGTKGKAVITDTKSGFGRYGHSSYLYEFWVGGDVYEGNSLVDDSKQIGDSIDILYFDVFPSLNRPVYYFK